MNETHDVTLACAVGITGVADADGARAPSSSTITPEDTAIPRRARSSRPFAFRRSAGAGSCSTARPRHVASRLATSSSWATPRGPRSTGAGSCSRSSTRCAIGSGRASPALSVSSPPCRRTVAIAPRALPRSGSPAFRRPRSPGRGVVRFTPKLMAASTSSSGGTDAGRKTTPARRDSASSPEPPVDCAARSSPRVRGCVVRPRPSRAVSWGSGQAHRDVRAAGPRIHVAWLTPNQQRLGHLRAASLAHVRVGGVAPANPADGVRVPIAAPANRRRTARYLQGSGCRGGGI